MAHSRVLKRFFGSGTNGHFVNRDQFFMTTGFVPLKDDIDLLLLGVINRGPFKWGGTMITAIDMTIAGDVDLFDWLPWEIDNLNNQLSGFSDANGAVLTIQALFHLRVNDASVNLTPKIYNITAAEDAAISGAVACSATSEDLSGSNQQQTVSLTIPANAKNKFKPRVTKGGSVGANKMGWAMASCGIYVQSTT